LAARKKSGQHACTAPRPAGAAGCGGVNSSE
jgi:hypothetical protein